MARFGRLRENNESDGASRGPTRRQLLVGGGAGAGLAIAWAIWPRSYALNVSAAPDELIFNAWLKVSTGGRVVVIVPQCEMGQGVTTLLPQIVADELGADWRSVAVEPAPPNPVYANRLVVDEQAVAVTPRTAIPDAVNDVRRWVLAQSATRSDSPLTMGSTSVRTFEQSYRDAAATVRMMLVAAAADLWDVDPADCRVDSGFVVHKDQRVRFGEVAADAARQSTPGAPEYRVPGDAALYGRALPRIDTPAKLDGSADFAGDLRLPDMVFAAIRHGPYGDTTLESVNIEAGKNIIDLIRVVEHPRWVAAVANNWWAANRALDAIAPVFNTAGPLPDSDDIMQMLEGHAQNGTGTRMVKQGDVDTALQAGQTVTADSSVMPALHAGIETRTATARMVDGRMQLWVASQAPGHCRRAVAGALGVAVGDVTIFQSPAGGSFGAALSHDVAVEAALIAREIERPVQLIYARAEETMRVPPRVPAHARITAAINEAGSIEAWKCRIAVPASAHQIADRLDGASADTAARQAGDVTEALAVVPAVPPYSIANFAIDHVPVSTALPAGRWRGNADSYCCFFTESLVDELAQRARIDPIGYRMAMLTENAPLARCLSMVGVAAGWQGSVSGAGQGVAVHSMRGSHIALVAEARMGSRGLLVTRMTAVVDAGRIVNPDIARQQIEGGLVFGLAAVTGASTEYVRGLAKRTRMRDLHLPHLAQSPEIAVEFVDSDTPPGGLGELGVPVVAPAIANALAAATGTRQRSLPFSVGKTS